VKGSDKLCQSQSKCYGESCYPVGNGRNGIMGSNLEEYGLRTMKNNCVNGK
jgi:hypothetical protein